MLMIMLPASHARSSTHLKTLPSMLTMLLWLQTPGKHKAVTTTGNRGNGIVLKSIDFLICQQQEMLPFETAIRRGNVWQMADVGVGFNAAAAVTSKLHY